MISLDDLIAALERDGESEEELKSLKESARKLRDANKGFSSLPRGSNRTNRAKALDRIFREHEELFTALANGGGEGSSEDDDE